MPERPLYASWDVYPAAFPLEGEAVAFYRHFCPTEAPVLDVGCGDGGLVEALRAQGVDAVGLDPMPGYARLIRGSGLAMPFGDETFGAVISRLFGCAYAATDEVRAVTLARELARVTCPGGKLALEVPVAWRPRRLQGIEEHAAIEGGSYRFRYLDLLAEDRFGAVLATRIEVVVTGTLHFLDADLRVYTPTGVADWLLAAGFTAIRHHAPYELNSACDVPPQEVLLSVVTAERGTGSGAAAPSTVAKG